MFVQELLKREDKSIVPYKNSHNRKRQAPFFLIHLIKNKGSANMNEPIKNPKLTRPESYNPKTPKLLNMMEDHNKPASITELQAYISSSGEPPRTNKIIGIRRLWHDDKSENFQLEGCFTAVMKAIGESLIITVHCLKPSAEHCLPKCIISPVLMVFPLLSAIV